MKPSFLNEGGRKKERKKKKELQIETEEVYHYRPPPKKLQNISFIVKERTQKEGKECKCSKASSQDFLGSRCVSLVTSTVWGVKHPNSTPSSHFIHKAKETQDTLMPLKLKTSFRCYYFWNREAVRHFAYPSPGHSFLEKNLSSEVLSTHLSLHHCLSMQLTVCTGPHSRFSPDVFHLLPLQYLTHSHL